jgi:hypothetical protein
MPVGMQVTNDNGVLQIDDTYKNIQLISKTSVTSMTQVSSGTLYNGTKAYWYYDIVVSSATNPVIALNGNTTQWLIIGAVNISGSTYTFRVFSDADVDFTYYVFDVPTTSGTVGFEVYNSSGELQFTATRGAFKPTNQITTTIADGNKSTTLASGKTYAVVTVRPGRYASSSSVIGDPKIPTPDECSQQYYIGGFKLNGTALTTNASPVLWFDQYRGDDFSCGLISGEEAQIVLVIDVSNY